MNADYLKQNIKEIENKIAKACETSGRTREEITLVSVTKTFEMDLVNESLLLGIEHVGENKVQEILRKFPNLSKPVTKHMIGHLQRNKVKQLVGKVDLIHSVDSIRLLDEIEKQYAKSELICELLIQINIGEEEQKSGIDDENIDEILKHAAGLEHVRVRGLMGMTPRFENSEEARPFYKKLKKIFETQKNISYNGSCFDILSMGMSGDFEVAIQEGANMIRLGSAIYGNRIY